MSKELWVVSGALWFAACGGGEMQAQTGASTGNASAGSAAASSTGNAAASNTGTAGATAPTAMTSASGGAGAQAAPATTSGASGGAGSGGMSGSTGTAAAPSEPTFTNVYNALFAVSGIGGCFGCHGGLANPALNGNFAMLSDQATTYKALVSAPSSEASVCKDMTRVTAGDPMKSLLYLKLSGMQPCGMPMPPGTPLSPDVVSLIKDWIAAGAKND
jgi:hypothetical protein